MCLRPTLLGYFTDREAYEMYESVKAASEVDRESFRPAIDEMVNKVWAPYGGEVGAKQCQASQES